MKVNVKVQSRIKSMLPYLLLLPAMILVFFMFVYPLVSAVMYSFTDFKLTSDVVPRYCGMKNFIRLFEDKNFISSMKNTFWWVLGSNVLHFSLGLGFALLMNAEIRGRGLWRSLFLLPWITPVAVVGILWKWLLNVHWGLINHYLVNLHILSAPIDWLGRGPQLIPTLIFINGWKAYGFMYLCFLSGLQSIPIELHEAAKVDGASGWQRFIYVTFPMLKPVTVVVLLLGIAWTLKDFNMIWIITQGGPGYDSMVYGTYVYKQAFKFYDFGYASAIGLFGFLLILVFAALYLRRFEES